MGTLLDKPKTEKYNEAGSGKGLRYGIASMQGWRVEMEDAHCAIMDLGSNEKLKDWSFFAIFDGHAGAKVSAHCAKHLLGCIVDSLDATEYKEEDFVNAIKSGFLSLDASMRVLPELASGQDKSGSTAVCALVSSKRIFVANCGDSRAILCSDGRLTFSTQDHKPVLPNEKKRIQNAGGSVMLGRVNSALAVSRALGDYEYKNAQGVGPCDQIVSPEPEIYVRERSPSDEFLVLACDGIWDVMSNDDLCNFVRSRLTITHDLESITNQVIDTCLYKESCDNMSIILVTFPGAPSISPEAIQKEKELEKEIECVVKNIMKEKSDITLPSLWDILKDLDVRGLPPGGGMSAKKNFVESVFTKLSPSKKEAQAECVSEDLGNSKG